MKMTKESGKHVGAGIYRRSIDKILNSIAQPGLTVNNFRRTHEAGWYIRDLGGEQNTARHQPAGWSRGSQADRTVL